MSFTWESPASSSMNRQRANSSTLTQWQCQHADGVIVTRPSGAVWWWPSGHLWCSQRISLSLVPVDPDCLNKMSQLSITIMLEIFSLEQSVGLRHYRHEASMVSTWYVGLRPSRWPWGAAGRERTQINMMAILEGRYRYRSKIRDDWFSQTTYWRIIL